MEKNQPIMIDLSRLTEGERIEMKKLGILSDAEQNKRDYVYPFSS